MKALILIVSLLSLSLSVLAQADTSDRVYHHTEKPHLNGYTVRDGKTVLIKNGAITPVSKTIVLVDGTQIAKNGAVIKKDGTMWKLQEGEYITLAGKKQLIKPDSAKNDTKELYLVDQSE